MAIELYEVNPKYIDFLVPHAPHLFQNKQSGQHNERKYIGVVLNVNNLNYFAPLSSFKLKHERMKNGLDFIKIGNYAAEVYKHKLTQGNATALAKRCNDFVLLEEKCTQYSRIKP